MKLSPNYFSKRQSFAIFILVLTVVALELLFVLWPFALPFFHQSDKFLEAQIEKEYQVLQSQSLKTKSSYSGLFVQSKVSNTGTKEITDLKVKLAV